MEGFGTKLDELMQKLEGTAELAAVLKWIEDADKDSLEYESDIDGQLKSNRDQK